MKSKKSNQVEKNPNHSKISSKSFKVFTTDNFIAEAKRLKKKYPSISDDFHDLLKVLKKDPITGNRSLGKDCYKIRMIISDKNTGESGGARVIIQVKIIDKKVYLLSVYDKSEKGNLFDNELEILLKNKLLKHKE
jgi:hypothetical protein